MNKIILVHYIYIGDMTKATADKYLCDIRANVIKDDDNIINYIIPIMCGETRVDCLNPKLVSDEDYKEAKELLDRNQKIVNDIMSEIWNLNIEN